MPVVGHAVVGLATALQFKPAQENSSARGRRAVPFWTPLVVICAYLPDIVTQTGRTFGWRLAGLVGHSMPLGLIAGLLIAAVWVRATGAQFRLAAAVITGSILCHDLLDLLQTAGRAPFWPLMASTTRIGVDVLPGAPLAELLWLGAPLTAWFAWRARRVPRLPTVARARQPRRGAVWAARALVGLIIAAAVVTQVTRRQRARQLDTAERLLRRGDFAAAIEAAGRADRWPFPGRPGRLDLIRGEAHERLGNRPVAEAFYLRAYRDDPTYFWAVADLAEYYAAVSRPSTERRALVEPYVEELRQRFAGHAALPEVLSRVEQRLQEGL